MKKHCSVSQIGYYPPPYGGATIHIKRLHILLQREGIPSRIYCQKHHQATKGVHYVRHRMGWSYWLIQWGWRDSSDVIHSHVYWEWTPALLICRLMGRKIVSTFHDELTIEKWKAAPLINRIAARCLFKMDRVEWIAVSNKIAQQLKALGVKQNTIHVIPAFLTPAVQEKAHLPDPLENFLNLHSPSLCVYGFQPWIHPQLGDIYGYDLSLELIRLLQKDCPHCGLVMLIPSLGDEKYLINLQKEYIDESIKDNVIIWREPIDEILTLWQSCDIYLRPSRTDGDSVAVREALSLGVPVIASDASERPEGTVLFPKNDMACFVNVTKQVLRNIGDYQLPRLDLAPDKNFRDILSVYND
jgi:glycosyltransferase involved in cell wall biosynthesis